MLADAGADADAGLSVRLLCMSTLSERVEGTVDRLKRLATKKNLKLRSHLRQIFNAV